MTKLVLPLLLLLLASPVQALKMVVKDRELASLKNLGYGESTASGQFKAQFVRDFNGPVTVMFVQSAEERDRNQYPGLKSSYEGFLKDGQLSINADEKNLGEKYSALASSASQASGKSSEPSVSTVGAPLTSSSAYSAPGRSQPGGATVPFNRFLQAFRLNLNTSSSTTEINIPDVVVRAAQR